MSDRDDDLWGADISRLVHERFPEIPWLSPKTRVCRGCGREISGDNAINNGATNPPACGWCQAKRLRALRAKDRQP